MKTMQDCKCRVFVGSDAESLFNSSDFNENWERLWKICPWSTVFQHRDFVSNWFRIFTNFTPIVVSDWDGTTMSGLMVLTFHGADRVVFAGLDLAEYQVWLSQPESSDSFIINAVSTFKAAFPNKSIHFKYIPSSTPLTWISEAKGKGLHLFLKQHEQPLMYLDKDALALELKKKNRKEKINRLNRLGNFQYVEIKTTEDFRLVIDEMALQSDLRKGAFYNKTIFSDEPERKVFLVKMFEMGLMHVSLLKVDDTIIASNAGFKSEEIIHLQGINSHSPSYSKYSPGILLFLMLGVNLAENGLRIFDLTPGGKDGYKSMLANSSAIVHELLISNPRRVFLQSNLEKAKLKIKTVSSKYPHLEEKIMKLLPQYSSLKRMIKLAIKNRSLKSEIDGQFSEFDTAGKIYLIPPKASANFGGVGEEVSIRLNSLEHLLFFEDNWPMVSKKDFLSESIRRIEIGHRPITLLKNGKIMAQFWYIPALEKNGVAENLKGISQSSPRLACSIYDSAFKSHLGSAFPLIVSEIESKIGNCENLVVEIGGHQSILLKLYSTLGFETVSME